METILAMKNVDAGYGRIHVLNGLSFRVRNGQTLGVIGPNGSGKTTMINALSGLIRVTKGSIQFEGRDITRLSPDARCRMGIARTFQVPAPFERMRVFENVLTAAAFGSQEGRRENWKTAEQTLALTGLTEKRDVLSGSLMLLDRKRLEIARALSTQPTLLLLDEIAAGLTSEEVQEILRIVRTLKEQGLTIIWIEHIIETLRETADEMMCMAEGRNLISGTPEEVLQSEEVVREYLGGAEAPPSE